MVLLPFLKIGDTIAFLHWIGTTPLLMECWKNLVKGLLSGLASSLSTNGDILSGPGASRELRAWSILKTPSTVTLIFGAVGTLQSPLDGILGSSSLPKTEQYWLLRMFALPFASDTRTPSDLRGDTQQ